LKQLIDISIPASFQTQLFFKDTTTISINLSEETNQLKANPFIFDIAYHEGFNTYHPWEVREDSVPTLFHEWEKSGATLAELFRERKRKEAEPVLIKSLAYFIMALYWTNREPVTGLITLEKEVINLKIKPVNCVERLSYILGLPNHYHSFIQLTQLFEELKKQFQKSIYMDMKK
jgi:hypothetical protein